MYEMTIQLKMEDAKCLYQQIYEHIRDEIKTGKLLAGEKLPSTRSLANNLQVSRSTVDYAYEQLLSEGYIEASPYRGYYVCRLEEVFNAYPARDRADDSLAESDSGTVPGGESDAFPGAENDGETAKGEGAVVDFSPYAIDMTGFPASVWKKITKHVLDDDNRDLYGQGQPQGDPELRLTVSRYLHSARGVECTPAQIVVGAGNDYLLMLLAKILGRRLRVAMENPTYKRAGQIFASSEYEVVTVDMDAGGMRVKELNETDADVAYVMPSHQFPTGVVMPIGRRAELLRWASDKPGRYLIEDDYDSEFRYHGKPIPALQASDEQGRVIYMGTFSKAIAPAIRVSYMVLPTELLERYRRECYFLSCTVSRIDQRILNEFIRDGYFERHLNKMRKLYRAKHELLLTCLEPFRERFAISGENAGLHLVLTAIGDESEEELTCAALAAGVKVYGMYEGMPPVKDRKAGILIGFGGLSDEEIVKGITLLESAWGIEKK